MKRCNPFEQEKLLQSYRQWMESSVASLEGLRLVTEANEEAARAQGYIFLSHSNQDRELAEAFAYAMAQKGLQLYVDLFDSTLPRPPSAETARKLEDRIGNAKFFLLLATKNSVHGSVWCPWEVGYAEGVGKDIAIVVTKDKSATYGAEYLQMYPMVGLHSCKYTLNKIAKMKCESDAAGSFLCEFDSWIE